MPDNYLTTADISAIPFTNSTNKIGSYIYSTNKTINSSSGSYYLQYVELGKGPSLGRFNSVLISEAIDMSQYSSFINQSLYYSFIDSSNNTLYSVSVPYRDTNFRLNNISGNTMYGYRMVRLTDDYIDFFDKDISIYMKITTARYYSLGTISSETTSFKCYTTDSSKGVLYTNNMSSKKCVCYLYNMPNNYIVHNNVKSE